MGLGPLRPGIVSPMRTVPKHIKRPEYAETGLYFSLSFIMTKKKKGDPVSERTARSSSMIEVKTPEQIEKMRKACRVNEMKKDSPFFLKELTLCCDKLAREVLDLAGKAAKPGVTTDEIDRIVHEATIERGAYPSTLNYRGFPKSCCT